MANRSHMTFREKQALHALLSEVLTREHGSSYFKYIDGWDDETVAKKCSAGIASIRRFRQENFGQIKKTGAHQNPITNHINFVQSQVAELTRRVDALEARAHSDGKQPSSGGQQINPMKFVV